MRRLFLLLVLVTFLAGCNSSEIEAYLEAGNNAIHEEDYKEAIENYSKALAVEETKEVKFIYDLLTIIQDAEEAFQNGGFELSISLYQEALDKKDDNIEIFKTLHRNIEKYIDRTQTAQSSYNTLIELINEGKVELQNQNFDKAADLFQQAASIEFAVSNSKITTAIKEAETAVSEAIALKKTHEEELKGQAKDVVKEKVKEKEKEVVVVSEQTEKEDSDTSKQPAKLTPDEAREYLKTYLEDTYEEGLLDNPHIHLEYDHDNKHGDYVFHLFEVIEETDTEEASSATWGWYAIDPVNKHVYDNTQH